MKKLAMMLMLALTVTALTGCGDPCKEDPMTKLGDTLATLGKDGLEKDRILLERKTERAGKCAEKEGNKLAKGLGLN